MADLRQEFAGLNKLSLSHVAQQLHGAEQGAEFGIRTLRNSEKPESIPVAAATTSFGDDCGNGNGRASNLTRQTISFVSRRVRAMAYPCTMACILFRQASSLSWSANTGMPTNTT
ncbi:MAG TPA: hypothetical protein VF483_07770 [Gemmatimonadaceae bacterium]